MEKYKVEGDYIQLNQLLKVMNWGPNGAEANYVIDEGLVIVNGVVEYRKRNKIRAGFIVEFEGMKVEIE